MSLHILKIASFYLPAIFLSHAVSANTQNHIMGTWQVVEASINTESQRTLNYQYNDDRLVGREMTITPTSIAANFPGGIHCQVTEFNNESMTLDAWITKTEGTADSASAQSYHLKSPGNEEVTVFTTHCSTGNFSGGDTVGNALIALSQQRMRLNWSDGIILTLFPVKANTAVASFPCAKASSVTEKTICGDRELASYDVSVNRSFNFYRQHAAEVANNDLQQQITQGQKRWLLVRNSCGKDKTCLKATMQNRLETLAHSLDNQ
ncbi:hypothetical protein GCM10022405_19660 [Gibbsiella dentisursi]|uniref:DUF1311 domain-containing protein n=1 Tax=Gibbsiella dentisursi TaxID=796890 RepID=A0ABP7L6X6_9GAMM